MDLTESRGSTGTANAAADMGSCIHELAEGIVLGQTVYPSDVAPGYGIRTTNEDLQYLWGRVHALWEDLEAHFPAPTVEQEMYVEIAPGVALTGRADVVSVTDEDVRVLDWKSGRVQYDAAPQLLSYATLAMALHEKPKAYVCVAWLRESETEAEWVTAEQAEQWCTRLVDALGKPEEYRTGYHCQWCPRNSDCPELTRAANALVVSDDPVPVTAENVLDLHYLRQAVQRRVDAVDTAVRAYVREHGAVPAEGGKVLGFRPGERSEIVFRHAAAWLDDNFPEYWPDLVSVSKSGLEKLVAAEAPRGEKKAAVEEAMDALRERQALKTRSTETFTLFKPKEDS